MPRLTVHFPCQADLPGFLYRTGICVVRVYARGAVASAQADALLRQCPTITHLICTPGFWPDFWPPNLKVLSRTDECDNNSTLAAFVERQHVQLLRLQDASKLERLDLQVNTAICHWPAALAKLPGSLQQVRVAIDVGWTPQGPDAQQTPRLEDLVTVDLSAFSPAAGCTAELHVTVHMDSDEPSVNNEDDITLAAGVLAGLCALDSFRSFSLSCAADALSAHAAALKRLRCPWCELSLHADKATTIAELPASEHLTLTVQTYYEQLPVSCAWAALASAGMRCLGSAEQPAADVLVTGCTGLPAHDTPWALVVWGDPSHVQGLPAHCFVQEAPGKHVWRNAAAAGLEVDSPMPW